MKKWLAFLIVVVAVAVATSLLRGGGITVAVTNVGTEPMYGVVLHVTGASYSVGELAPGASKSVVMNPSGESHVEIEQKSGHRLIVDCYFEPGYSGKIAVEVTSTKVVTVKDQVTT